MNSLLRNNNLKPENIFSSIDAMIKANSKSYGEVQIRCVAVQNENALQNALCMITPFTKEQPVVKATSVKYQNFYLLEDWLPVKELLPFVQRVMQERTVKIGNDNISLGSYFALNSWEYLPGTNDYFRQPGYLYQGRGETVHVSQEPIIEYDAPLYIDQYQAIQEWIPIRNFHNSNDSRLGSLSVFLPECRTYFQDFIIKDKAMRIVLKTNTNPYEELRVKGVWQNGAIRTYFEQAIDKGEAFIPMSPNADSVDMYLIGPGNILYDYHRENRLQFAGQARILQPIRNTFSTDEVIQKSISNGEGQNIEFKPYIFPGNEKEKELIETVIAFANTSGGKVLIGVNDQCVVTGVEKELHKEAQKTSKTRNEYVKHYVGHLRNKIAGALNNPITLTIEEVTFDGHTLIMIDVPERQQRPYAHFQTNDIYVRHGANNVRPTPGELSVLFANYQIKNEEIWKAN